MWTWRARSKSSHSNKVERAFIPLLKYISGVGLPFPWTLPAVYGLSHFLSFHRVTLSPSRKPAPWGQEQPLDLSQVHPFPSPSQVMKSMWVRELKTCTFIWFLGGAKGRRAAVNLAMQTVLLNSQLKITWIVTCVCCVEQMAHVT